MTKQRVTLSPDWFQSPYSSYFPTLPPTYGCFLITTWWSRKQNPLFEVARHWFSRQTFALAGTQRLNKIQNCSSLYVTCCRSEADFTQAAPAVPVSSSLSQPRHVHHLSSSKQDLTLKERKMSAVGSVILEWLPWNHSNYSVGWKPNIKTDFFQYCLGGLIQGTQIAGLSFLISNLKSQTNWCSWFSQAILPYSRRVKYSPHSLPPTWDRTLSRKGRISWRGNGQGQGYLPFTKWISASRIFPERRPIQGCPIRI